MVNPLSVDTKADNYAYFLQDTWRPASNFTINLGARMEIQRLYDAFGNVSADIDDNLRPDGSVSSGIPRTTANPRSSLTGATSTRRSRWTS